MKRPPDDLARKLLQATDRLPERGGFDISIDEIARMVNVPRATLYYYFSGKDDLVEFYMNDKLERTSEAIQKAAVQEGPPRDRLEGILIAILESLSKYPRMCVELPAAVKGLESFQSVMANAERWVLAPVREVLIEGRSTGDFQVADPVITSVALMGALVQVGMFQVVSTGEIDAGSLAGTLVPELMRSVQAS